MSTLLAFPARWVPYAHTAVASLAFSTALFAGWASGLWKELCINSVSRWPVEWWPSVSATVGDHAPSRAPFHILIALCATPRFLLLLVQWIVHRNPPQDTSTEKSAKAGSRRASPTLVDVELGVGVLRTFFCGGWVYITSRDQHDLHDLFMILYLLLTVPWMELSARNAITPALRRKRRIPFFGFLSVIPPLLWMYYRHSTLRIPGAYTYYSMFEWALVFWDIYFDALSLSELGHLQIAIIDTSSPASGAAPQSNPGSAGSFFMAPTPAVAREPREDPESEWTTWLPASPSSALRASAAWLSDVYFAVCFWTVFTSLGFQLFYWSVWKLALAGSELALIANLAGYVFASKSLSRFATSRSGHVTHRTLTVIFGMGCYFFPWPAARLLGVFVGTWAGWSALFGTWVRLKGSEEMVAEGQILGLGLGITMFLKYANSSVNPLWAVASATSGGWNKTGLAIAALSLVEYAYRPLDLHPSSPLSLQPGKKTVTATRLAPPSKLQQNLIAIGLGAHIHLIQTFLTDAGTIISWTWTGYPIKGPTLHPYAAVIIAASAFGTLISTPNIQPFYVVSSCAYAAVLYLLPDWRGFGGGVGLAFALSAVAPAYFRAASACSPAKTLGNALLVNIVLDVVSVVTAAYAFVPMGWIFRERTDLVLGFCILASSAGLLAAAGLSLPSGPALPRRSHERMKATFRHTAVAVLLLSAAGAGVGYNKFPKADPVPYYPEHRIFSGGIWTVHFGVDKEGRDSQTRMMELIRDMQVDVIGLLESDLHRFVYGNRDLTRVISEELGYYVDLGPGPNKHTWGAALLSKFPIINSTHHLLPSPYGELAPAIHATLDVHGQKVNVMVSHNGQEEDALDRELQTTEIARLLRETEDTPTVFLGYLVTRAGDRRPWPYQILMEDGKMLDIEIEDRWRWCEYIAFRGLWRIGFARVHESDISDTELQVGKFLLPKPGETVRYESNEELYWHIGEKDVPEPWRMPSMFRGKGTRGHRYVIWDGPLYYMPPVRSGLRGYGWEWSTDLDTPERP
ncbi:hypothetical protein IAT38_006741 [Cryptococcus sp. DSM 104549]